MLTLRTRQMLIALAIGAMLVGPAFAETIELVTYYPAPGSTGDQRARSLTVGTGYQGVDMSASDKDGVALIYDKLWIGQGYTAADPAALRVVGFPGVADKVLFLPGTNGTLSVGVGTVAPASVMHVVTEADDATNDFLLDGFSSVATAGSEFVTRRARGTAAAPTDVAVGDDLGGVKFFGYRGGVFLEGATIDPEVDSGPVVAGQVPTTLSFRTAGVQRLSITSTGNVGIGTTAPAGRLHVQDGDIRIASTTGLGGIYFPDGSYQTHAAGFSNFQYFASSGTWTVPSGVTRIMVEVWGAGGGGGNNTMDTGGGYPSGGGGGAYGMGIYAVVPGTTYTVTVGLGGNGESNGRASSFGALISAGGGAGAAPHRTDLGGAGGISTAPFNISGQRGGGPVNAGVGAAGGGGGSAPRGGLGAPAERGDGLAGGIPGGGGGGSGGGSGGRGGDGGVMVWW